VIGYQQKRHGMRQATCINPFYTDKDAQKWTHDHLVINDHQNPFH